MTTPYTPTISEWGHDYSGPEGNLTTAQNLLSGDPGICYFATDTGRLWLCTGQGVWVCVGFGGLVAPGGAGSYTPLLKYLTGLTDNTATNLAVVTIPNVIAGGGFGMTVSGNLGDGDSAEQSYWTAAVSRVPGANAKLTLSSKANNVNTTGAAGNAAVTLSAQSVSGAVGAVNTFQLQGKVARSAGSATGHSLLVAFEILNNLTGGITVA